MAETGLPVDGLAASMPVDVRPAVVVADFAWWSLGWVSFFGDIVGNLCEFTKSDGVEKRTCLLGFLSSESRGSYKSHLTFVGPC